MPAVADSDVLAVEPVLLTAEVMGAWLSDVAYTVAVAVV